MNTILENTSAAASEVQGWVGPIFSLKEVNGKLRLSLDENKLKGEAVKTMREYLEAKAKSGINLSPRVENGIGTNMNNRFNSHEKIMRDLMKNPDNIAAVARGWVKRLSNKSTAEAQSLPSEYIDFLNSIAKDNALEGGLDFFKDYVVNTSVNQSLILNTFVAPIDSFINSGENPRFIYNRVNSFIAPGPVNHLGRNIKYEVVKFDVNKQINIITKDFSGNTIIKIITPKLLDGVEFISPQYSIETTNAVGAWNRMLGNLKTSTSGINNEGDHVFHKNMSVVLTRQMADAIHHLKPLYDRMIKYGIDKIVTTDGTKSKAEQNGATKAVMSKGVLSFESEPNVLEYSAAAD